MQTRRNTFKANLEDAESFTPDDSTTTARIKQKEYKQ